MHSFPSSVIGSQGQALTSPGMEGGESCISYRQDARHNPAWSEVRQELTHLLVAGVHGVDDATDAELRQEAGRTNRHKIRFN